MKHNEFFIAFMAFLSGLADKFRGAGGTALSFSRDFGWAVRTVPSEMRQWWKDSHRQPHPDVPAEDVATWTDLGRLSDAVLIILAIGVVYLTYAFITEVVV